MAMHTYPMGCSWYEKVNSGNMQQRFGVMFSAHQDEFHVVNLTENGKLIVIKTTPDMSFRTELDATVNANISSDMQTLYSEFNYEVIPVSWYEKVNSGNPVRKYGILFDVHESQFQVMNFSENGKYIVINATPDVSLKAERVSTVRSAISSDMYELYDHYTTSQVTVSTNTDAAHWRGNYSPTLAAGQKIPFVLKVYGDYYDGGEYTAPFNGVFTIVGNVFYNAVFNGVIHASINNSVVAYAAYQTGSRLVPFKFTLKMNQGDVFNLKDASGGGTLDGDYWQHYILITGVKNNT